MDTGATQPFKPIRPEKQDTDTRELHPDVLEFAGQKFDIMGPDGFFHEGMMVRDIEKRGQDWIVTLYNPDKYSPENPDSEKDTLTMTIEAFKKEIAREVVESPRVFSKK